MLNIYILYICNIHICIITLHDLTVIALGSHVQVMKFYFKQNVLKKKKSRKMEK